MLPRMYGRRDRLDTLLAAALLASTGACADDQDHGPGPKTQPPAVEEGPDESDAPVRLAYVCGNRFLVTNTHTVPVTVTYRVSGTAEEGAASLAAAKPGDPEFTESTVETRNRGAVELFLEGRRIQIRANRAIPCSPSTPAPSFLTAGGSTNGRWSAPFPWPHVAVHLSLLPTGKVLSWGRSGPQIWNPATGGFTLLPPAPANLFCAGHAGLADGRILFAGGRITDARGPPDVTILDPARNPPAWSQTTPMRRGRWYPSATTMANGEVVIMAGRDESGLVVPIPEVWSGGALRRLTTASLALPYYPRAFLAPNGKLFYAGEQQTTRYLNTTGSGTWTSVGNRRFGVREYGAAVMYERGKILYVGGGRTTNTAEIINLTKSPAVWTWTGSMAFRRRHLNATILPTGDVLVTGGVSGPGFNDIATAVHAAELWSPWTGAWRTLASNSVSRGYHATSLLLPDGRVLHSGSGDGGTQPDQRNAELFSPPYLFAADGTPAVRPVVTSAPAVVHYGQTMRLQTPNAATIRKASLIRLGSVTHAFDMNQRFQSMSFTADPTGVTVQSVSDRRLVPPGYYMIFLLNANRVPSVGRIVLIN
jgi:galactose oxidase